MALEHNLKHQFLLAMPGLAGGYFGDTVTYLCEHNEDGAMGLVINRPSELRLVELLYQVGLEASTTSAEIAVLDGGPVARERGFILHHSRDPGATFADKTPDASVDLGDGLMLTAARDVLEAIAAGRGPDDYLVALGYAGWDAGQLEQEIKDNAWLTCPADLDVLFRVPYEDRVSKAAALLGIDFRLLSGQAGHA